MNESPRILSVLGGYGIFGSRIAEALCDRVGLSAADRWPQPQDRAEPRTPPGGRVPACTLEDREQSPVRSTVRFWSCTPRARFKTRIIAWPSDACRSEPIILTSPILAISSRVSPGPTRKPGSAGCSFGG